MSMTLLQQLAISLGLGLLVGLQREWRAEGLAGIRTFALVTLFGTLCGYLAEPTGGWVVPAGLLALSALLVLENRTRLQGGEDHPGPTTEIAAMVMYMVGVAIVLFRIDVAVVVGVLVAVLLHWKGPLHAFAERIGMREIRSIIRLALIGLVILPLLPDRTFGPLAVLNPFEIWLMVVFIAGISVVGYLAQLLLGERVGTLLAGFLGGLISSTATTVAYARRTRGGSVSVGRAAVVVVLASVIVFGRVFFEVGVVAPAVLPAIAPPLLAMTAWVGLVFVAVLLIRRTGEPPPSEPEDPSNLAAAITFGLLYAAVLVGVDLAQRHFGPSGLYAVSVLSGLTDMDAITLSTAQFVESGIVDLDTGWRMILVGAMSNLLFKGLVVAALGNRRFAVLVGLLFLGALGGGGLILWLWPAVGGG